MQAEATPMKAAHRWTDTLKSRRKTAGNSLARKDQLNQV